RDGGSIEGGGTVSIAQWGELIIEETGSISTAVVRVETEGLLTLKEGATNAIGLLEVNAGEVAIEGDHTFEHANLSEGGRLTGTGNTPFQSAVTINDFTFAAEGTHPLESTTSLVTSDEEEIRLGIEGNNTEVVNKGTLTHRIEDAAHQSRVIFNE